MLPSLNIYFKLSIEMEERFYFSEVRRNKGLVLLFENKKEIAGRLFSKYCQKCLKIILGQKSL
jgi:hypothetical protein